MSVVDSVSFAFLKLFEKQSSVRLSAKRRSAGRKGERGRMAFMLELNFDGIEISFSRKLAMISHQVGSRYN